MSHSIERTSARHILPFCEPTIALDATTEMETDIRLSRIAMVLAMQRPNLLDLACDASPTIVRATDLGWRATAVLDNPRAVAAYRHAGFAAFQAPVARLPFPTDFFDVVTAWFTIEAVADAKLALREWKRVLRPGGLLVLEVHRSEQFDPQISESENSANLSHSMRRGCPAQTLKGLVENELLEVLPSPGFGRLELLGLRSAATSVWRQIRTLVRTVSGTNSTFQIYCRRPASVSSHSVRQRAA